jgi:hypothetical protein
LDMSEELDGDWKSCAMLVSTVVGQSAVRQRVAYTRTYQQRESMSSVAGQPAARQQPGGDLRPRARPTSIVVGQPVIRQCIVFSKTIE